MNRLARIFPWLQKDAEEVQDLVNRIASRSLNSVWQRVCELTPQMSPAEAKGYIRATAAAIVESEMGVVKGHPSLATDSQREVIRESSLRTVVQMTLQNVRKHVQQSMNLKKAA